MKLFNALTAVPTGVRSFFAAVRLEYEARQLAEGLDAMERANADYSDMSEAEKLEAMQDAQVIQQRAQELRVAQAAKKLPRYYRKRDRIEARRKKGTDA